MYIAKSNRVIDTDIYFKKPMIYNICNTLNYAIDELILFKVNITTYKINHMKKIISKTFNRKQTTQNYSKKTFKIH